MGEISDVKSAWVLRVLGVAAGDTATAPRAPALPLWLDAKEAVDAGISRLQQILLASDDADLRQIGEYGLLGITEGRSVKLMAALRDADSNGTPEARAKLAQAASELHGFLDSAPIIALLEDNPFGVPIPIRSRMCGALAGMMAG